MDKFRNAFARSVINFMLKHVATREYGYKIDLLIQQGLFYADIDENAPFIGRPEITGDDFK